MTKPIGPICNLDCKYCFYLEKEKLYPTNANLDAFKMPFDVLENYIQQYLEQQDIAEINFAWQGGEPTLLGIDFFKKVVEFQQKYARPHQKINNAFQTNGILIDADWAKFFHEHQFLVGLSLDGPRELHDLYRTTRGGKPSFDLAMRGLNLLKEHKAEFNTLTVVHRELAYKPLEVYHFLKEIGSGYMQFIPLVERIGNANAGGSGAGGIDAPLANPPTLKVLTPYAEVTPWSVEPLQYGTFLCAIFDEWVRNDVGRYFVQMFDVQLGIELGYPASLCVFAETCGKGLALEHNGDLYACDHFVYPHFKLGNLMNQTITEMVNSPQQIQFGIDKHASLPRQCQRCEVGRHCNGECPKHRFNLTIDGEPGLNYLCAGYKKFFNHMKPNMRIMADLLRHRRPAADIMAYLAQQEKRGAGTGVSNLVRPVTTMPTRNDPCPCGSGKKFKKCCAR